MDYVYLKSRGKFGLSEEKFLISTLYNAWHTTYEKKSAGLKMNAENNLRLRLPCSYFWFKSKFMF